MIRPMRKFLGRFRRDEDGAVILLEFLIFVPLLFTSFLMAVEMGLYSMRQMWLDRGLDIAVREIRLNTSTSFEHDQIKDIICANTGWLEQCDTTLRLEMDRIDPRAFAQFNPTADCIDTAEDAQAPRGFTLGQENQMMMLRACVRFDPVFPTSRLGRGFEQDGNGKGRMISVAAFVQEPG